MGPRDVWCVKFIGEIGGTNAVYTHFIERPENLQGTAECAIGSIPSLLSSRRSAAVTVLWMGEEVGHGCSTEGAEIPRG
jgi:hypothetical protein